jgi:hypothetical protein
VIADPASVVLTAHLAHWLDEHSARTAWVINCILRHNSGDWGDLDDNDTAANDHALRIGDGRLMSRYPVPTALADPATTDDAIWIITDDVADPETVTTILWPSDY